MSAPVPWELPENTGDISADAWSDTVTTSVSGFDTDASIYAVRSADGPVSVTVPREKPGSIGDISVNPDDIVATPPSDGGTSFPASSHTLYYTNPSL